MSPVKPPTSQDGPTTFSPGALKCGVWGDCLTGSGIIGSSGKAAEADGEPIGGVFGINIHPDGVGVLGRSKRAEGGTGVAGISAAGVGVSGLGEGSNPGSSAPASGGPG